LEKIKIKFDEIEKLKVKQSKIGNLSIRICFDRKSPTMIIYDNSSFIELNAKELKALKDTIASVGI